jgi:hypothetical protein
MRVASAGLRLRRAVFAGSKDLGSSGQEFTGAFEVIGEIVVLHPTLGGGVVADRDRR